MEITSFAFIIFFASILLLYYIVPKRWQWGILLAGSLFYYWIAGSSLLILYPVLAVTVTWFTTWVMEAAGEEHPRRRTAALIVEIASLIGVLALLKYIRFGETEAGGAAAVALPLGLSFYTFTLVGYAIDVEDGIARRQKNFFKLLLYGMFFPTMISGPIQIYRETGEQLTAPHRFDYDRVTKGLQRMVWGFFKKLVICLNKLCLSHRCIGLLFRQTVWLSRHS